jgi:hypothetical protein
MYSFSEILLTVYTNYWEEHNNPSVTLFFFQNRELPHPLHQSDAYAPFLLLYFEVRDTIITSSWIGRSGYMDQPAKNT